MNPEHFVGKIAQKALIVNGDQVLVSRDVNQTNWDIPGGRLHVGETPREGLEREVKEELGVEIEIGGAFYTDTFLQGDRCPHFLVAHEARLKDSDGAFKLAPGEIEEVRWINASELDALPMWPQYKRALLSFFSDK